MSVTCDNIPEGTVCASDDETTPVVTQPVPEQVTTTTVECENGKIVGYTPTGQPLFLICGPTNPMPGQDEPVPDHCLPMGQMSQSLMPCNPATGQIIWDGPTTSAVVAVGQPPVPVTLPDTGTPVGATMIFGSFALLMGVVLRWTARRHQARTFGQAMNCPTTGENRSNWQEVL